MEQANEHIDLSSFREKFQELLNRDPGAMNPDLFKNESLKLLSEFEQCQLRLEKQYQELNQLKEQAEKIALEKYAELFDFSPTGFFTVTEEGVILNSNRRAAYLLNKEKEDLTGQNLSHYIKIDSRGSFAHFLAEISKRQGTETCVVTFHVGNKRPVYAHLSGVATNIDNQILIGIADVEKGSEIYEEIIQELNPQKEQENKILKINKKLRNLTAHLQNAQEEERIRISREIHDELG